MFAFPASTLFVTISVLLTAVSAQLSLNPATINLAPISLLTRAPTSAPTATPPSRVAVGMNTLPPVRLLTRAPTPAPTPLPTTATNAPTTPCQSSVRPLPFQTSGFRVAVTTSQGWWLRRCSATANCFEQVPCLGTITAAEAVQNYFDDPFCRTFDDGCQGVDANGRGLCMQLIACGSTDTQSPIAAPTVPPTSAPSDTEAPTDADTSAPIDVDTRPPTVAPTPSTSAPTTPCQSSVRPLPFQTSGFRVAVTTSQGWWLRRCSATANCFEQVPCLGTITAAEAVQNYFDDPFCRTFDDGCQGVDANGRGLCMQLVTCGTTDTQSPTAVVVTQAPTPATMDTRAPTGAPTTPCARSIRPLLSHAGLQVDIITDGLGYWLRPCPSFQGCFEVVRCDASWTSATAPAGAYVGNWFGDRQCRTFRPDCQIGVDGAPHCFAYRPCISPTDSPTMAPTESPTLSPTLPPTRPPVTVLTRPPTVPPRPCGDISIRPFWSRTGLRVTPADGIGAWLRPCPNTRNCYEPVQCDARWTADTMPAGAYEGNWFGDRQCRSIVRGCQSGIEIDASGVPFFRHCLDYEFCGATLDPTQAPTRPPTTIVFTRPPTSVFTWPPITVITGPPISIATRPPTSQPPTTEPPTSITEPCQATVRPLWSTAGISLRVTTGEGHWLRPCPNTPGCYMPEPCSGSWTADTMPAGAYDGNFFGDGRCRVIQGACETDIAGDFRTGFFTSVARCLRYLPCSVSTSSLDTRAPTAAPTTPPPSVTDADTGHGTVVTAAPTTSSSASGNPLGSTSDSSSDSSAAGSSASIAGIVAGVIVVAAVVAIVAVAAVSRSRRPRRTSMVFDDGASETESRHTDWDLVTSRLEIVAAIDDSAVQSQQSEPVYAFAKQIQSQDHT